MFLPRTRRRARPGKTLVLFVLLTPALAGVAGLVIDGGLLMAAQRQAQNAADAAAMAAAMDVLRGRSVATANTTANSYVTSSTYNNLPNATVTLNNPPASGPHAGNSSYFEVLVQNPIQTTFIRMVGVGSGKTITARLWTYVRHDRPFAGPAPGRSSTRATVAASIRAGIWPATAGFCRLTPMPGSTTSMPRPAGRSR